MRDDKKMMGPSWDRLDEEAQDNLILLLQNDEKSDEEVIVELEKTIRYLKIT